MKQIISIFLFCWGFTLVSFGQQVTTIKGYAPDYIGSSIYVYGFQDLLSLEEEQIAVAEVKPDSTFSFVFQNDRIQKVVIRSENNFSYLYAQPGRTHEIYLPLHDKDKPFRPLGNYVTSIFIDMDSSDINDKIVKFNDALDRFYALNLSYYVRNRQLFMTKLNEFKDSIYATLPDENSFLRRYVFYSFADADMSVYTSEKASQFIYDAYINRRNVLYDNEMYFHVIKKLYSQVFGQLSMDVNGQVYRAILKKSPKLIMKALEEDYFLSPSYDLKDKKVVKTFDNAQLRELVMIKGLAEIYYNKEYPRTNVVEILDSIAQFPLFPENGVIAQNIIKRLTWMSNGNQSPDFALTNQRGKTLTLKSLEDKYIYFHFFKPEYAETPDDIMLLKAIQQRYGDMVQFISVYPETNDKLNKRTQKIIESIPWSVVKLDENDDFFKRFRVQSFPSYILIDRTGMVIGAPALTPRPNGQYHTIDKVFFDIRKVDEENKKRARER